MSHYQRGRSFRGRNRGRRSSTASTSSSSSTSTGNTSQENITTGLSCTLRSASKQIKRKDSTSDSEQPGKCSRKCEKSGCPTKYPVCFAVVAERCAGKSYTSRWYHMSGGEHFCNECFEYFYRSNKAGYSTFIEWKSKWATNGRSEPSVKTFMAECYLPFWIRCTNPMCSKWREIPLITDLTSKFISHYQCGVSPLGKRLKSNVSCTTAEDPRVQQALQPEWIETLILPPYLRNSPAADLLGAYYPDGVGMSPTCNRCIEASQIFKETRLNNLLKPGRKGIKKTGLSPKQKRIDSKNTKIHPSKSLNPNFQPFYQPQEQGKAFCFCPDMMDFDEMQEFKEYSKEQAMYLGIRNLILVLWYRNCKKWLTLEDVEMHLICRGLVRVRCMFEAYRILQYLTCRGIINIGILNSPPDFRIIPEENEENIIIIGAGTSGLGAARHLQNLGQRVLILEGRERIGGRVQDICFGNVSIGKGAQIITGVINNPLIIMCEQIELPVRYIGEKCDLYNPSGFKIDSDIDRKVDFHFNAILDSVAQWRNGKTDDIALYDKLMEMHKSFIDDNSVTFSKDKLALLNFHISNLEYACGSSLTNVSSLHWDQNDNFVQFAGEHTLLPNGYTPLLNQLADTLDIRLNSEVKIIDYSGDKIKLATTTGETFHATKVLVTLPLAVLQSECIEFIPSLPEEKQKALSFLGAGVIEKVALHFPFRFWDTLVDGADFFGYVPDDAADRGHFAIFYDMTPQNKQAESEPHILMTYLSGDAVQMTQEKSDQHVVDHCLNVLNSIFHGQGIKVPKPTQYFVSHWSQDKFSLMAYSYVKVGGSGEAYDALAKQIGKKLFFAGEATSRQFPQTVTGAYLSGLREARKIISSIMDS